MSNDLLLLTRIRSCPGSFANLPCSVSDAAEFFQAREGSSTEKLFWSQYATPEHPVPFTDQLKQLVELHRVAELGIKDLIIRLWPAEAMPDSYFGLVRSLVDALPRIDAVKRWSCMEGASMVFSHVKMHWVKMNAEKVAVEGPLESKAHRTLERYFEDVLKGTRLIEGQCSKDVVFEYKSPNCVGICVINKVICNIFIP